MSKKGKDRRRAKFKKNGKYKAQFIRTVKRLGRWRGKKAEVSQAK